MVRYSHILLSPRLIDKYSTYNNNIYCVVLLITDNFKDLKGKSKAFVDIAFWNTFEHLQSGHTYITDSDIIFYTRKILTHSLSFGCGTNCSIYWLKVTIYLGHSSLPCITNQLAGELVTGWSRMVSCMSLQVGSCQFGCRILRVALHPQQAGWLTLMLVSGL